MKVLAWRAAYLQALDVQNPRGESFINMQSEIDVIRDHFDRYRAVTLQYLDIVPAQQLTWRPDARSFSIGEHLQHIVQTEHYYCRGLFEGAWDTKLLKLTEEAHSPAILRAQFTVIRKDFADRLERLSVGDLRRQISVPNAPGDLPLRCWLWFVLEHEIHHKAQLAVYLKQIGLVAPFYAMPMPLGVRPDIAARQQLQEG